MQKKLWGVLAVVVAAALLGLQARNGPPLEAWHTEHLATETDPAYALVRYSSGSVADPQIRGH